MSILLPDETVRNKNLDVYESIYNHRLVIDPDEKTKYRAETTVSGDVSLTLIKNVNGRHQYVRMNSSYDPVYEADRWANGFLFDNKRTVIAIMGLGLGYRVRALMENMRPDTVFFIYEPCEGQLAFVCSILDLTNLFRNDRVFIFTGGYDNGEYLYHLERAVFGKCSQAHAVVLPDYEIDNDFEYACRQITSWAVSNDNYQKTRGRISLKNRIYSWCRLHRNMLIEDMMKNIPKELPVIIVAGGPSLNKNVEILKEAKGKALIVCIDRAVSVLVRHGIIPDLLATIDPEKSSSYIDFSELKDIPMLCAYQAGIDSQRIHEGNLIYCIGGEYEKKLPEIGDRVFCPGNVGGNVAAAVYTFFAYAGIKTIILIGQDLANLGKETHADGNDDGAYLHEDIIPVEGIGGTIVESNEAWITFRNYYEDMIRMCPETSCVDATEGGALIHGSTVMTLQNAINELCINTYDINSILCSIPKAQTLDGHDKTVQLLRDWENELQELKCVSAELESLTGQLLKISRYQDIADPKVSKKLDRLDKLREKVIFSSIYPTMTDMWIEDVNSIPDTVFVIRNNEEAIPVFENANRFYSKFPDDCESLRQTIEQMLSEEM